MLGEIELQPDGSFIWFVDYVGDANSGVEDEYECHDVTWEDFCEAAEVIRRHGYEVTETYAEHDFVSATFRKPK